MSKRLSAEDQGWSSTGLVLDGQTIERSGDAMCGLHCEQGDEKHEFLGLNSKPRLTGFPVCASKPATMVWQFGPQNYRDGFSVWTSKQSGRRFVDLHHKTDEWIKMV
jgi:hypothetical protein